ncbi:MAG: glycosyltransferase family 2 protein [Lachnospiraceae bacterium]|nr:glycosyltransferase family 2 protein [Lachnospiraceae bacterium]
MSRILGIFTCFNRKEKTLKCLQSLQSGNPKLDFHFLAVDDKSTDGTAEALDDLPEVTVIPGSGNLYYTGGMRKGIQEARKLSKEYDYALIFNDDVEFYSRALERLVNQESPGIMCGDEAVFRQRGAGTKGEQAASERAGKADRKAGPGRRADNRIWVGAACDRQGSLTYGGIRKKSRFRPSFQILMAEEGKQALCHTFNANCVLIPWEIFRTGPDMDEHFRHSLGDFDYGLQLWKQGNEIAVSDFFVGICEDNPPDGTWRDTRLSRRERFRLKEQPKGLPAGEWFYFIHKYFGFFSACVYTAVPYVKILLGRPT